ncbi:MAG: FG-GAP-like repeat-containing protein, partial [Planctomycetota bacterium]
EGLRGNVARLISSETLYSVPDARGLSHWKYVLPPAEGAANEARGKERILLPGPNALTIFAFAPQSPQETPDPKRATYAPELVLGAEATGRDSADEVAAERKIEMGNSRMRMSFNVELESTGFVFEETDSFSNTLFDVSASLPAPGLADLDGDRRTDLLLRDKKELRVHFADRATFRSTPDLVNALPSAITDADGDKSFLLRDLEGDGDDDLVVLVEVEDGDSFENHEWRFMVWRNEGGQLFSDNSEQDSPDVLMRFEGSRVSMRLVDVTGDGRLDLFLREVKLPSKLAVATGFKFTLTSLIFEGNDSGFARRPLLKQSRVFDENTLASAIAQRVMNSDLSGDGVADLVEIDLAGRIAIRRLVKTKKFFGGTSWELEESPWKRFDVRGTVVDLSVEDVNGDGLGDILSVSEDRLVLLLSNPSKNRSSR